MNLHNVTLEISAKPFKDDSEQSMYKVGRTMFTQWKNLTDEADQISVMLWVADGSEILNWSGDLDQTFEWAYWQGCAEAVPTNDPSEILKRHPHLYPRKYREDAAPRTYRWLKRMIQVLRECCMEINGKNPKIIAIFDNGPEFCISDFKYRIHKEICGGSTVGGKSSVTCNSVLKGDKRKYAAYPNGIPDGLPLGRFFGEQFRLFAKEFGYDAIWLSNGMGFGKEPWSFKGFLFDGNQFHPEEAASARATMLQFWKEFTTACPGIEIQTRGSNLSAGVEIASDGAPLDEIYHQYKIVPPVNSPWAALNFNAGLEIAAWMSHIAELPGEGYPYRFYTHDPWFRNSPWLDRYGREPWDIYLPLAVGRIDENGKIESPNSIALLTIDDSCGEMPDCVPQEVTPHLLHAFRHAPDSPAPFVWVYPFHLYGEMVHGSDPHPEIVFSEDMFIGDAIQGGFPLNTVVSLENMAKIPDTSIVLMPVSAYGTQAEDFLNRGGKIIFYGSLRHAPESLKKRLGLRCGTEAAGKQPVTLHKKNDSFRKDDYAMEIFVHEAYDGGALTEIGDGAKILAEAGGRVLASVKGNTAFLRSVLPLGEEVNPKGNNISRRPANEVFPVESLSRTLAEEFGWSLKYSAFQSNAKMPCMMIYRHRNMFYFSLYARDTSVQIALRTPIGVPVLDEMEAEYTDSYAVWHPGKCWNKQCRAFVDQTEDSVFSMKIKTSEDFALKDKFELSGLIDATVRIFLPEEQLKHLEFVPGENSSLRTPRLPYEIEDTEFGKCAVIRNVSGFVSVGIMREKY